VEYKNGLSSVNGEATIKNFAWAYAAAFPRLLLIVDRFCHGMKYFQSPQHLRLLRNPVLKLHGFLEALLHVLHARVGGGLGKLRIRLGSE
jgi:hypothetical protein